MTNNLPKFLWRYFSGHHLDGKARTNATWFKRGTLPPHHVTWWSAKPRIHRLAWRWALVFVPAAWVAGFALAPAWRINAVLLVTVMVMPYVFHHGTLRFLRFIPRPRIISVMEHTISTEHVDSELDDFTLAESEDGITKVEEVPDFAEMTHPRRSRKNRSE